MTATGAAVTAAAAGAAAEAARPHHDTQAERAGETPPSVFLGTAVQLATHVASRCLAFYPRRDSCGANLD